jgi:hypothetical protein
MKKETKKPTQKMSLKLEYLFTNLTVNESKEKRTFYT